MTPSRIDGGAPAAIPPATTVLRPPPDVRPPSLPSAMPRRAALLLVYGVAMILVFRVPLLSGFDLGFGERGDAMIEITILEHWRNVLRGAAAWNATFYFHPYPATLGYNDGYFLYGLVYSFWRLFADPFHADTLDILTFKTIGFVAAHRLVARTLGWGSAAGALVALLWTVASNIALQAVHAQLQSVALLPLAMMLAIGIIRAARARRCAAARCHAVALAALMAAWLMTSYYMAWFTIFSACLYVVCWCALSGYWRPVLLRRCAKDHAATLACAAGAFAVLIVPFLGLYLPKMRETGGESYAETLGYLVTPVIDMVNVGPGNYLWGWLFRPLFALVHAVLPGDPLLPERVLGREHEAGFPPVLLAFVVAAAWGIVVRRRTASDRPVSVELRAFAVAMTIGWLLTLQFWLASPWGLVFHLVPGAKGLRVVSRYQLWLALPFLLIAVAAWRERAALMACGRPWLAGALVTLLVAENLSAEPVARLRRSEQRGALADAPAPPRGCASFYVVAARTREPLYIDAEQHALYPHNVDAMFLAEWWGMPTINGFSTFNPPDWNFARPWAPDYDARVRAYARRHGLRGLCRLDVRHAPRWTRVTA